jgi:hypothetical protein
VLRRVGGNQYSEAMLEMMARAAWERGQPERAAVVLGAASALRLSNGTSRDVLDRSAYDETMATTRAALGDERFTAAWTRGQSLSLSAAIAEAVPPIEEEYRRVVPAAVRGDRLRAGRAGAGRRAIPRPDRP